MITERTANRLSKLAAPKGISVQISASTKPRRRWYSIGMETGGAWHQIAGFVDAEVAEEYIQNYGK